MQKRIQYLDIAKGIGILLVVLGHNDIRVFHPTLHYIIFSFHVPLFFFLSGMFFKPERPLKEIATKRFNTLMKPLIFIILLIYGIPFFFGKMGLEVVIGRLLKSLFMTGPYLNWEQLWFLPALFVINIYAFVFYRLTKPVQKDLLRWLVLLLSLWVGTLWLPHMWTFDFTIMGRSFSTYGLPASIDLALIGGFFFILGRELYQHLPENFFASKIVLLASATVFFGMAFTFNLPVDLNTRLYPSWTINTLQAVAGIIFTLSVSWQIEFYTEKATRFFSYIGALTLPILLFHVPIEEMVTNKIIGYIGANDLTLLTGLS